MGDGKTLPACFMHALHGFLEHRSAKFMIRSGRKFAVLNIFIKRRLLKHAELVAVDAVKVKLSANS